MVHLIPSWVKGISRLVCLMKYLILQLLNIRHTDPSFVPQHSLLIFQKTRLLLFLDVTLDLMNLLIFHLTSMNLLEQTRTNFHLHDFCIGDDSKVELVELFTQLKWHAIHHQLTHMRLETQSVSYHFSFPRVIVDSQIVILDMLQPSSLPKVQVQLCEDVLQTLVICVYLTSLSHQIVPPNLESVNYIG
jgi:hypothetical protein